MPMLDNAEFCCSGAWKESWARVEKSAARPTKEGMKRVASPLSIYQPVVHF